MTQPIPPHEPTPYEQVISAARDLNTDHYLDGGEWTELATALHTLDLLPTKPTSPRGGETSNELTEVRTVLSRAEHALTHITYLYQHHDEMPAGFTPDPDAIHMINALTEVIALLRPYQRTNRRKRR